MNDEQRDDLIKTSKMIDMIYDLATPAGHWSTLLTALDDYVQEHVTSNDPQEAMSVQLDCLSHHLLRATGISNDRHASEEQGNISTQLLNKLPIGFIIINKDAKIIAINQQASETIASLDSMNIKNNMLSIQPLKTNQLLHEHIATLLKNDSEKTGVSLSIKPLNSKQALSLWLTPLDTTLTNDHSQKLISIYLVSPFIKSHYDASLLQQQFGLTRAETRLATTLSNGCHSLVDAAESLHVSIHTLRSQIKSIFRKTHCSNQVELVKLILTSPAILKPNNIPHDKDSEISKPLKYAQIKLFDSRDMSYVEYGDANGEVIVYCHALIHSDQQFLPHVSQNDLVGYRIIMPVRSGFMGSTWAGNKHNLHDYSNDIMQLLKKLAIKKYKVMGYSYGSSYAAALAYYFPQNASTLTLISPIVPPHMDSLKDLSTTDKQMVRLSKWLPFKGLEKMAKFILQSMYQNKNELIDRNKKFLSPSEIKILQTEALQNYVHEWVKSVYPTSISAVAYELTARVRPWGFLPADISVPTQIWHAQDDTSIPSCCSQALAKEIPNAIYQPLGLGGHYALTSCFKKIINTPFSHQADFPKLLNSTHPAYHTSQKAAPEAS